MMNTPPGRTTLSPKWSLKEVILASFVAIFGCLAISLLVVFIIKEGNTLSRAHTTCSCATDNMCLTPACTVKTATLLSAMNHNVDPCDDFYHYACGMWILANRNDDVSQMSAVKQKTDEQLRGLLKEPSLPGENTAVTKAKILYASCVDLWSEKCKEDEKIDPHRQKQNEQMKNQAVNAFKPLIKELGGWPVLDPTWNSEIFNLEDTIFNVGKYLNVIFETAAYKDKEDRNAKIIMIQEATLSTTRAILVEPQFEKSLNRHIKGAIELAVLLGASNDTATSEMNDMIAFEKELATFAGEPKGIIYFMKNEKITINQLATQIPGFDWLRFLRGRFETKGVEIDDNEPVLAHTHTPYMESVIPLIQSQNRRTVANYIVWRLLNLLATELQPALQRTPSTFEERDPKKKCNENKCVDLLKYCMRHTASRIYVSRYVDISIIKKDVEHGGKYLYEEMKSLITQAPWMDNVTREYALKKLQRMSSKLGFDKRIMNDTWLEEQYEDLSYNRSTYLENVLSCHRTLIQEKHRGLRKRHDPDAWIRSSIGLNAHYHATANEIILPAGILQPPFYSADYPKSAIFAAIGFFIGHEITHGFDVVGRHFDEHGDVKNWWTNKSMANFQQITECFEKQYSNYSHWGQQMNGKNTLRENMADNGGLQVAYLAYQNWLADNGEDRKLPGYNYTQDQLFFITYAQNWCAVHSEERALLMMASRHHSPKPIRVHGPLSNSESFARAFNCPLGSTMNPHHKCTMW